MIEAIYQIGKVQEEQGFLEEFLDELDPQKYKHVFKIIFNIDDPDDIQYKGIEYEEFSSSKKMQYFYKEAKRRDCGRIPTAPITTVEKTVKKIAKSIDNFSSDFNQRLSDDEKKLLASLFKDEKEQKLESIIQDLIKKADSLELSKFKDEEHQIKESVLTIAFEKSGNSLYVGDTPLFRKVFEQNNNSSSSDEEFYKNSKTESRAFDKICYICRRKKDEVYGFVNTYNFYTVDKDSFISGGFKQKNAWRNYPVCSECAKTLKRGKKYIEKNLNYKFCGLSYYLIPELLVYDENTIKQILKTMKKYKDFSLGSKESALIAQAEEKILRDLASQSNFINFNFLFYHDDGKSFRILLNLQEVAPSRLKFLIDKKDEIDHNENKYKIFEIKTKKQNYEMGFYFQYIREFFPQDFNKDFLEITNNVFCGNKISADLLLSRFMSKITEDFTNDKFFGLPVLKAYKILQYINAIGQLDQRSRKMSEISSKFDDFFKENPMIDSYEKKALFLDGVLAQKLLNIQYADREAKPFRSRLNGLKIDGKIAKRVFTEAINKLEEYGKNYYQSIEEEIGKYFLKCDFSSYSIDEMSFYFTLGMTLAKHITTNEELTIQKEN